MAGRSDGQACLRRGARTRRARRPRGPAPSPLHALNAPSAYAGPPPRLARAQQCSTVLGGRAPSIPAADVAWSQVRSSSPVWQQALASLKAAEAAAAAAKAAGGGAKAAAAAALKAKAAAGPSPDAVPGAPPPENPRAEECPFCRHEAERRGGGFGGGGGEGGGGGGAAAADSGGGGGEDWDTSDPFALRRLLLRLLAKLRPEAAEWWRREAGVCAHCNDPLTWRWLGFTLARNLAPAGPAAAAPLGLGILDSGRLPALWAYAQQLEARVASVRGRGGRGLRAVGAEGSAGGRQSAGAVRSRRGPAGGGTGRGCSGRSAANAARPGVGSGPAPPLVRASLGLARGGATVTWEGP
jgi:hypothetical protein